MYRLYFVTNRLGLRWDYDSRIIKGDYIGTPRITYLGITRITRITNLGITKIQLGLRFHGFILRITKNDLRITNPW